MKKFKLPILVHSGLKPIITQRYANTTMVDFYKSQGITMPFHNGVDIVLSGTDRQTYGTAVVTPSEGWRVTDKFVNDDPMAPNGNGRVIHSSPFLEDGIMKVIELRFVHLSEAMGVTGEILAAGTIIGYIGNSGAVDPKPVPEKPYSGTHLHLGMCEYWIVDGKETLRNAGNGVYGLIDPLTRIDIDWYDTAEDTSIDKDAPPLRWGIDQLGLTDVFEKLMYVWKVLFPKK